jgi:hypothetical protein
MQSELIMFSKSTIAEIAAVAREFGHEPAALLAIAEVESGGVAYACIDDRREPLVRYEGHYFDRRIAKDLKEQARAEGLASARAGGIPNPRSQAGRWRLIKKAAAINRTAAYESVSWGLGQVMGAHWKMLGYDSVEALVADARSGAGGQARLMARYIEKTGIAWTLARRDWAAFARAYNGPGYRRNHYDTKIAAAYRRYAGNKPATAAKMLRIGSTGDAVRQLQEALDRHGFVVAADGIFGPHTKRALQRFQRAKGLLNDAIAGPATLDALEKMPVRPARKRRKCVLGALGGLFGGAANRLK